MHPRGVVAAGVGQDLGTPLVGGAVGVAGLFVATALVAVAAAVAVVVGVAGLFVATALVSVAAAVAVVVGIADDVGVVVGGLGELMRAW